jgi:hypothetical protein
MNSLDPYSKNELDGLVREALRARVDSQEPSGRVWARIRQDLAPRQVAPPRRLRARWPSLVAQSVLTLLLVMLGVAGLQTAQLSPTIVPATDLPSYVTDNITADDQDPTISRAIAIPVEPDVDALKTFGRPARQADSRLPSRLSEAALLERRLLRGEPASPFPGSVQERFVVFSSPPEE